jgi:hypothetical protein
VIIKAAAGGGGKGMRVAKDADEFERSFSLARSEALSAFGNGDVTSRSTSCARGTSSSRSSATSSAGDPPR